MAIDADLVPSRVSGRMKIPSVRAREAAEVNILGAHAIKKKRAPPRQSTSTPTTSGFSALSQSPKVEAKLVLNLDRQEKAVESESEDDEDVDSGPYCICRGPDDGRSVMIQCDSCDDWFHTTCVKLRQAQIEVIDKYFCPNCTTKDGESRKTTRTTDISYIGDAIDLNVPLPPSTSSRSRGRSIARKAALAPISTRAESPPETSPVRSPVQYPQEPSPARSPSLPLSPKQKSPSPVLVLSPPTTSITMPRRSLKLNVSSAQSARFPASSLSPVKSSRRPSPPPQLREPTYSLVRAPLPVSTKKRKSTHTMTKAARVPRDSSTEHSSTLHERTKSRIDHPRSRVRSVLEQGMTRLPTTDAHVVKKSKKAMENGGGRSEKYRTRITLDDRESERDSDPYDTASRPRKRVQEAERIKKRPSERESDRDSDPYDTASRPRKRAQDTERIKKRPSERYAVDGGASRDYKSSREERSRNHVSSREERSREYVSLRQEPSRVYKVSREETSRDYRSSREEKSRDYRVSREVDSTPLPKSTSSKPRRKERDTEGELIAEARASKSRRKEREAEDESREEARRRNAVGERSVMTVSEEGQSKNKRPSVSARPPAAVIPKRRPPPLKPTARPPAGQKTAAPVIPAAMTAEELETQRLAPALGLSADAVRIHCLGKLEAAFVKVFLDYNRALDGQRRGEGSSNVTGNGVQHQANGSSSRLQAASSRRYDRDMEVDFMEVEPPIRITEPIVLDEEESLESTRPAPNGHSKSLVSKDSGFDDPISSSIEILTGPQSSEQSVGNLSARPGQTAIAGSDVQSRPTMRDESEVEGEAIEYTREVEKALFEKTKQYSREKQVWMAGTAYKQQYQLVMSSLDGDLRPDLREGFSTRRISPAEIATMDSRALASEERLREMNLLDQEAMKSLMLPSELLDYAREQQGEPMSVPTSGIPEAIDLDSIVDLDDANTQETGVADANGGLVFVNGEPQTDTRLETVIVTSDTANFPLYTESPGLIAGPTRLNHSATTEATSSRLSPVDIVDKEDALYYSGQHNYTVAIPETQFSALMGEFCDDEGDGAAVMERQPSLSAAEEDFQRIPVVWKGGLLNPAEESMPFSVYARQAGGPDYSRNPGVWKFLNPADNITLVGRLPADSSIKFLEQNQLMPNRELIIVVFSAAEDDPNSRAKLEALFDFHRNRDRHGVSSPYPKGTPLPEGAIKDMYLVPLRPDESLDFLDLMPNNVLPRVRTQNILLGAYVIERTSKALFPPHALKARSPSPTIPPAGDSDSAPSNGAMSSHQRMLHMFNTGGNSPVVAEIKPYV